MARVDLTEDVLGGDDDQPPAPTPPPAPPPAQTAQAAPPAPPAPPPAPWKYSALLDEDDREIALRVEASVVRRSGIRATKGMRADILRALFALADADDQLQERLAERLRGGPPP